MKDTRFVKHSKSSPVPFRGQKRKWTDTVYNYLRLFCQHNKTVVDLFGGSGLLSRTAKDALPNSTVVFNDFDFVLERVEKYEQTLQILNDIKQRWVDKFPPEKRIPNPIRDEIRHYIFERWIQGDYIDWVTISCRLFFSGNYAASLSSLLSHPRFYNRMSGDLTVKQTELGNYVNELEIKHCDYKELIAEYRSPDTLFIIDPPYPNTNVSGYSGEEKRLAMSAMTNEACAEMIDSLGDSDFILFSNVKSRTYEEVATPRLGSSDLIVYRNAGKTSHNTTLHEEEFMWCRNNKIMSNATPDLIYDFMAQYNKPLER